MTLFSDSFKGKALLWKAFWMIGLFTFMGSFAVSTGIASWTQQPFQDVALIVDVPFRLFWIICIWRCANNTESRLWPIIAKFVIGLSIVSILMQFHLWQRQFESPQALSVTLQYNASLSYNTIISL